MAREFLSLPIRFEILMRRNDVRKQSRIHKTDIWKLVPVTLGEIRKVIQKYVEGKSWGDSRLAEGCARPSAKAAKTTCYLGSDSYFGLPLCLPTLFRVLSKVTSPLHWLRRGTWTWKWPLFNVSTLPTRRACLTATGILQWGLLFVRGSHGWASETEQVRSFVKGVILLSSVSQSQWGPAHKS